MPLALQRAHPTDSRQPRTLVRVRWVVLEPESPNRLCQTHDLPTRQQQRGTSARSTRPAHAPSTTWPRSLAALSCVSGSFDHPGAGDG
jgi:hypothetical protein